ncbi:MAG: hypothetical protein BAJALOKI2v1_790001 [Promethearchaeota archaeon]|nr:MAG: hypothetical protein BAJALOKI2v1_790001 [Candidatus Lokiarchaeota archaeon]
MNPGRWLGRPKCVWSPSGTITTTLRALLFLDYFKKCKI